MSVYKRGDSPFYHYDFQFQGRRFHGSTGCGKKADAKEYERERRLEAPALIAAETAKPRSDLTFDEAAGRFWIEVGQFYSGNARKTFKRSLEWLALKIGERKLVDIGNALVAELVAQRRGQAPLLPLRNARAARPVSNATVNRTVTEPLRRVLNRARDAWDMPIGKVTWKTHILPEPKERVRELHEDEEDNILGEMREDYLPAIRFLLASGCRLAEAVTLTWANINWGGRTVTVIGKGNKPASIPLTSEIREILWPLRGDHDTLVFTYVAQRSRTIQRTKRAIVKGERYPITYEGLKTAWRRHGAPAAGVGDFRLHDIRHTTATRLLRESGNLRLVQKLLRHEDIATTTKYAHAQDEDLRQAMEAVAKSRDNSRGADGEAEKKRKA